jgi:hypothetical protein
MVEIKDWKSFEKRAWLFEPDPDLEAFNEFILDLDGLKNWFDVECEYTGNFVKFTAGVGKEFRFWPRQPQVSKINEFMKEVRKYEV